MGDTSKRVVSDILVAFFSIIIPLMIFLFRSDAFFDKSAEFDLGNFLFKSISVDALLYSITTLSAGIAATLSKRDGQGLLWIYRVVEFFVLALVLIEYGVLLNETTINDTMRVFIIMSVIFCSIFYVIDCIIFTVRKKKRKKVEGVGYKDRKT